MCEPEAVLIIQTGGTIDKDYPKTNLGYAFEIAQPAVQRILPRARVGPDSCHVMSVCRKDSQDLRDHDREKLASTCIDARSTRILITHGTDSMIETAAYLSKRVTDKTIVITGAFLPETFKATDADFNVGFALGVLTTLSVTGVFIAMNGQVSLWSKCTRNPDTDMFERTL
ncbi:uncharacterized protein LOC128177139 [Crassostrea angulata]|uniref:uncharacterized protein LOC128177139 n=1 Tax=Magallana angulata TaxID=2784310 RepID=UPI0022B12F7A|nr:uncharacterized protein LOC128177139 [Crassostrea angulata]